MPFKKKVTLFTVLTVNMVYNNVNHTMAKPIRVKPMELKEELRNFKMDDLPTSPLKPTLYFLMVARIFGFPVCSKDDDGMEFGFHWSVYLGLAFSCSFSVLTFAVVNGYFL